MFSIHAGCGRFRSTPVAITSPQRIDPPTRPHATRPDARATYQVRCEESTGQLPPLRVSREELPPLLLLPPRFLRPPPSSKSAPKSGLPDGLAGRKVVPPWSLPEPGDELPFDELPE